MFEKKRRPFRKQLWDCLKNRDMYGEPIQLTFEGDGAFKTGVGGLVSIVLIVILTAYFAYLLFTLGLIGTGMLGVPVLVGSCAYAVAEGAGWRGSMSDKPKDARKFYAVMAVAMVLGLALNFLHFNAVKMLFWSAVINGLLAPPLILLVILLTSNRKVMGARVNSPILAFLGWATFAVMTAAAAAMLVTS